MQRQLMNIVMAVGMALAAGRGYGQAPGGTPAVPKELLQYVRDAWKAGMKPAAIQQNAVIAGWPPEVVKAAVEDRMSAERGGAALGDRPVSVKGAEPSSEGTSEKSTRSVSAPPTTSAGPSITPGATDGTGTPKVPAIITRGAPDDYQIGAGDELQISVWKEPDASVPLVVVRPDGKISMPLLKEVTVLGLTPTQSEKVITEQLKNFITAADVTVIVKSINSKKIYVVGGVKKEGPIAYTYRMTVLQALSEAGGLTDYAKKKRIYVLHHEGGRDFRYPFDYDAVLRGEKMELNIPLMPGDTLVVPK
jgi:polysaccharide export outer membrane protein